MEKPKLIFHKTLSVEKFKEETESTTITIRHDKEKGTTFFNTDSGVRGAANSEYKKGPVMSWVEGDNGEVFWLLHKEATANVIDTL